MRAAFLLLALVAVVFASSGGHDNSNRLTGWRPGKHYKYSVDARTLTALDVSGGGEYAGSPWAGVHLKGQLELFVSSDFNLYGRFENVAYGEIHHDMPYGWSGPVPQGVEYQSYPGLQQPFMVRMNGGLVEELLVPQGMGVREENLLKGMLSTLQYDTSDQHLVDKDNTFLNDEKTSGVYRKMETDVTGMCNTLYSVVPLSENDIVLHPDMAPLVKPDDLLRNGKQHNFLKITKTKGYDSCENRIEYNFGLPVGADWENNDVEDNFMTRNLYQQLVVDRYESLIHTASSTNRIRVQPALYGKLGMVVSGVNMTLIFVEDSQAQQNPQNLRSAGDLSYSLMDKYQGTQNLGNQGTLLGENGKGQRKYQQTPVYDEVKGRRVRRSAEKHSGEESHESKLHHQPGSKFNLLPKINISPGKLHAKNQWGINKPGHESSGSVDLGVGNDKSIYVKTPGIEIQPRILPGVNIKPVEFGASSSWNINHGHGQGGDRGHSINHDASFGIGHNHGVPRGHSQPKNININQNNDHSFGVGTTEGDYKWNFGIGHGRPQNGQGEKTNDLRLNQAGSRNPGYSPDTTGFGGNLEVGVQVEESDEGLRHGAEIQLGSGQGKGEGPEFVQGVQSGNGHLNFEKLGHEPSVPGYSHKYRQNGHHYPGQGNLPQGHYGNAQNFGHWSGFPLREYYSNDLYSDFDVEFKDQPTYAQNTYNTAMQVAKELEQPNEMPTSETVSKLGLLVRFVSKMDIQHLEETTNKMYGAKDQSPVNQVAWKLYRDALVLSGSGPAVDHLTKLINMKKIVGEEAAGVISILPNSLRYPTEQQILKLFSLSQSNAVKNNYYLNGTLLHAVTKLINKAYVDTKTSHRYYPVHIYKRFLPKGPSAIPSKILNLLNQSLRDAVNRGDSVRAQVYIEAIGNLGYPKILDMFLPYLTGKYHSTKFLRMHIVNNLDRLAQLYPKETRTYLYNIYKNGNENYEVRVAAIFKLLKSRPTISMLLEMAKATHTDPSRNVRSAIQSGIRSASYIRGPGSEQLVRNARTASQMLSNQHYGSSYSKIDFYGHESKDGNLGYDGYYFQIGSVDSIFRESFGVKVVNKLGAWMKSMKMQGAVSDTRDLLKIVFTDVLKYQKGKHQNIVDEISKLLNIRKDPKKPFEANMLFKIFNQERFYAFDESTLQHVYNILAKHFEELQKGYNYSYTKTLTTEDAYVSFPLAMGVPFYFEYVTPTILHVSGNIRGQVQRLEGFIPQSLNVTGDMSFLLAKNIEGEIGFVNTLNKKNQHISAGVIVKKQINIPISGSVQIDLENAKLSGEMGPHYGQDIDIVHYSVTPYTSFGDRQTHTQPKLKRQQTKLYKRDTPRTQTGQEFGREVGMIFETEIVSDDYEKSFMQGHETVKDFLMSFYNMGQRDQLNYYRYNLKYNSRRSSTNKMVFNFDWDTNKAMRKQQPQYQQPIWTSLKQAVEYLPAHVTPKGASQRQQMLKIVSAGIKDPHAFAVDVGLGFLGKSPANYLMTVAFANSHVDEKVRGLVYYNKKSVSNKEFHFVGVMEGKMPNIAFMNLDQVLKNRKYPGVDMEIRYGEKLQGGAQVNIHALTNQTFDYIQYLQKHPMVKACKEEMKNGNFMQYACREAIELATNVDFSRIMVSYQNVGDQAKAMLNNIFGIIRQRLYDHINEDWVNYKGTDNLVDMEFQLHYDMDKFNSIIRLPRALIKFDDVKTDGILSKAFIWRQPEVSMYKRVMKGIYGPEYSPTCVIDGNQIRTFGNLTYDYKVQKCQYVAMETGLSENNNTPNRKVSVTVVDVNGKKQIEVVYITRFGDSVYVSVGPNGIYVDGKKINIPKGGVYNSWGTHDDVQMLEIYQRPSGEYIVSIDDGELRIYSSGETVLVRPRWSFGGATRGLCGTMFADDKHTLLAPKNAYMRDPSHFAVTWAVPNSKCESQTKQFQQETIKNDVFVDKEWKPTIFIRGDNENGNEQYPEGSDELDQYKYGGSPSRPGFGYRPRPGKPGSGFEQTPDGSDEFGQVEGSVLKPGFGYQPSLGKPESGFEQIPHGSDEFGQVEGSALKPGFGYQPRPGKPGSGFEKIPHGSDEFGQVEGSALKPGFGYQPRPGKPGSGFEQIPYGSDEFGQVEGSTLKSGFENYPRPGKPENGFEEIPHGSDEFGQVEGSTLKPRFGYQPRPGKPGSGFEQIPHGSDEFGQVEGSTFKPGFGYRPRPGKPGNGFGQVPHGSNEFDQNKSGEYISKPGFEIQPRPGVEIQSRPGFGIQSRPGKLEHGDGEYSQEFDEFGQSKGEGNRPLRPGKSDSWENVSNPTSGIWSRPGKPGHGQDQGNQFEQSNEKYGEITSTHSPVDKSHLRPGQGNEDSSEFGEWNEPLTGDKYGQYSLVHPRSGGDDNDTDVLPQKGNRPKTYLTKAHGKMAKGCHMVQQVQYVEVGVGEMCITLPLPACSRRCSQLNLSVLKTKAHCRPCNDPEMNVLVQQIKEGGNPHLDQSKFPMNRELYFSAPTTCKA